MTRSSLFGLCDCNNFFVSCERVFRPDLREAPVLVLSSNDGCVISRSNEVKALGVAMGEPYFKIRNFLERNDVTVFSSNIKLYRDISRKVMETLSRFTDRLEIYSIDEAFLNLRIATVKDSFLYSQEIRSAVWEGCTIPVSVGVASTKTLAKLASEWAKRQSDQSGVFSLEGVDVSSFLADEPVGDVWGIGKKGVEKLRSAGVRTALELCERDDHWIRKTLSLRGVMTVHELRGISSRPLDERGGPQKSLQVSRSFGKVLQSLEDLEAPLMEQIIMASSRLRHQRLLARTVEIFICTSRFNEPHYEGTVKIRLPRSSSLDSELIAAVKEGLLRIYKPGYSYNRSGVTLMGLVPEEVSQMNLFEEINPIREKHDRLLKVLDQINDEFGTSVIAPASISVKQDKPWKPRKNMLSKWKSDENK